ncbi:pks5, partial [Symbiodinium sp. CCMP2456]
ESVIAAASAATLLRVKGYCVLQKWVSGCLVEKAQAAASSEVFRLPNKIVADGLLGTDFGLVELRVLQERSTQFVDGLLLGTLSQLSTQLYGLSDSITHCMDTACGFCQQVSAILFRQGAAGMSGEISGLSEVDASRWLDIFRRHRLLSMAYLGPQPGILDLWMFEESDRSVEEEVGHVQLADPQRQRIGIELSPGDVVVLRPELLARKLRAPVGSLAMMSLVLGRKTSARRVWPGQGRAPAAKALDEWTRHRLLQLSQEDCVDHEVPFAWRKDLQRSFDNGRMVAVRSAAGRFPRADTVDDWCRTSITAAADYATEVPFRRWDHSEVYDPDDSSVKKAKSACRHAAFLDGVELFPSHAFKMPEQDVRRCDPYQRLCAEAASSALHGESVKRHGQRSGGLFVGCPSLADWEHDGDGDQALLAGRLSVMLGLRGPSDALVHSEGAAGLAAASLAATALEAELDFALAIGVHLSLSPRFWLCCCRATAASLSRRGRSLAFDTSCDGFAQGSGAVPDGKPAGRLHYRQCHGCERAQHISCTAGGSRDSPHCCGGHVRSRGRLCGHSGGRRSGAISRNNGTGRAAGISSRPLCRRQSTTTDLVEGELRSSGAVCRTGLRDADLGCHPPWHRNSTAAPAAAKSQCHAGRAQSQPSQRGVWAAHGTQPLCWHSRPWRWDNSVHSAVGIWWPYGKGWPCASKARLGILARGRGRGTSAVGVPTTREAGKREQQLGMKIRRTFGVEVERMSAGPDYCLIGSWDNWTRCRAMRWDADCWRGQLHLGGEETFQILKDGDPDQAIFPNCRNARFGRFHVVQGPAPNPHRLAWLVGEDGGSSSGDFEVFLSFKGRRPLVTLRNVSVSRD